MNKYFKTGLISIIVLGVLLFNTQQGSNNTIAYATEIKDVEVTNVLDSKNNDEAKNEVISTLYVNGNKVDIAPYQLEGVTYVPLKPIVEGIGDKYSWDNLYLSAIVTTNSGKTVQLVTGWSIMVLDGECVPITTQEVNGVTVSEDINPVLKNGIFYVPLDIISDTLSYPVDTTEITNIYVGEKPESITPTEPETTEPVEPEVIEPETTEETDSIVNFENVEILKNEYGFRSNGEGSAFFNSQVYYMRMNADVIVGTDIKYQTVTISITNMADIVKPYVKNAFNVYFSEQGNEVYSMVEAFFNGNGNQYLDKYINIGEHRVYLHYSEQSFTLRVTIYNK